MATAKTTKPPVLLELSFEEAKTLADLAQLIAGHPDRSRRCHIDAIDKALESVGVFGNTEAGDLDNTESIEFKESNL